MVRYLLLGLTAVLAAWSSLVVVKAGNVPLWILAIGAGELGHYFAVGSAALAAWSWRRRRRPAERGWAQAALVLALIAAVVFLRPLVSAARLAPQVEARLPTEFAGPVGAPMLHVSRLLVLRRTERGPVRTYPVASPEQGQPLPLDFYPARTGQPAPCVVVIHGGGWDSGDRTQFASFNHELAQNGYAVAAISYRLAPQHPWPAQREDTLAAVRWLKAHAAELGVDPERLVLLGRSAGGQIATAVAYAARDPAIRGVISFYAPYDMAFVWSIAREDDVLNSVRLMRQYLGGPPEGQRVALYESASAQRMVEPGATPPTLLLHGRLDELVWVEHSRRLFAALTAAQVPAVYVELPWATHGWDVFRDGPGGQIAAAAVKHFLAAVTLPPAESPPRG